MSSSHISSYGGSTFSVTTSEEGFERVSIRSDRGAVWGGVEEGEGKGRGGVEVGEGKGRGGMEEGEGKGRGGVEVGEGKGRGGVEEGEGKGEGRGGVKGSMGKGDEEWDMTVVWSHSQNTLFLYRIELGMRLHVNLFLSFSV